MIPLCYFFSYDFSRSSMLQKQILHSDSMNLCFDGSVMSGDVDIMGESICQVSVSQLVLVCNESQSIAQIYAPCESKHIMSVRFTVLMNAVTAPHRLCSGFCSSHL